MRKFLLMATMALTALPVNENRHCDSVGEIAPIQ
jgi:hypothetical protein